jgi:hypothetical protein
MAFERSAPCYGRPSGQSLFGSGYNADLIALPVDGKFILLPPKDNDDASE